MQPAYKSGYSTESALLKAKNCTHNSLAKGECLALTLHDLSAAFDTINHQILLHRLTKYFGIPDHTLKLFTSSLILCTQSVKVNNILTKTVSLLHCSTPPPPPPPPPARFGTGTNPIHIIHYTVKQGNLWFQRCPPLYVYDIQIYTSLTPENAITAVRTLQPCILACSHGWHRIGWN